MFRTILGAMGVLVGLALAVASVGLLIWLLWWLWTRRTEDTELVEVEIELPEPEAAAGLAVAEAEGRAIADRILAIADPSLIKVLMKEDEIVGFVIAYPDLSAAFQRCRGQATKRGPGYGGRYASVPARVL